MPTKSFLNNKQYIHIPICDEHPINYRYIQIFDGDVLAHEFHIGVAHSGKKRDFYVALYLGNYTSKKITFSCDDEVPDDFFVGFIAGAEPEREPELYPDLYSEPNRQQIHFSPRCGWMNDPNGLFWKDGLFHIYFQHNPFGSRHGDVNVSWGHAISHDGVHFKECPDAIMPYSSRCFVASGSSFVDVNNIAGKGAGTVIASYTALQAKQFRGRPRVTQNEGQMLLYSKDNGMTFQYFDKNPIIEVPDGEQWRDPKIFEWNGELVAIVYEPINKEKRTSFYSSKDGSEWKMISNGEKFHECPDFFELEVQESNEKLYVMYGGDGKYSIGTFENLKFNAIEQDHYLDYGETIYAGQSFSNYPSDRFRYHIAWMRDSDLRCFIAKDYVFQGVGFNQSMSLICKLSLHKTAKGYRVFRTPNDTVKDLRKNACETCLRSGSMLDVPAEYTFSLDTDHPVSFRINGQGFDYDPATRSISSTGNKTYELCSDQAPKIRMFVDTRSIEFFVEDEISLSYFATPLTQSLTIEGIESIQATKYELLSIWENIRHCNN